MDKHEDGWATAGFAPAPRLAPPEFDAADIELKAPPEVMRLTRSGLLTRVLPLVMAGLTVAMMVVLFWSRSGMARNPMFLVFPVMMLVSATLTGFAGRDRRAADLNAQRADYLGYLSDLRQTVVKTAAAQHTSLYWRHPEPDLLWTMVGGSRMWERRSADNDFCQVRIGIGPQGLATRLVPPQIGPKHLDPVTAGTLRRFLRAHSTIPDVPITLDLRGLAAVTIAGEKAYARDLLRAMICQLAVLHSPSRLLIVAAISERNRSQWDWLKWLPHNQHPSAVDDVGTARMVYPTLASAGTALADQVLHRVSHLVIVVDGGVVDGAEQIMAGHGLAGVTILEAGGGCTELATRAGARLLVTREELRVDDEVIARPVRMDSTAALVCARRLAAFHDEESDTSPAGSPRWQDLHGIGDVTAFAPTPLWRNRSPHDRLRVPIGVMESGAPLDLDIKEAAENGMGPHGLCVGATGSGKSELLRGVALGMMVRHSPEALNLVLVDFKGGATFLGLEHAPHVAAVITNLSEEAPLVARMRDALTGEMNRRQQVLRAAGNLESVAAYRHARQAGAPLSALPALFIIVDEFSELLSQHPDFADVFAAIGRLGRSLGIHLLLASQRLDEGRLRGLESHLSYRICLKTLSAHDSRIVLGTADAYELPTAPGAGYLRLGTTEPIRFQSASVSGQCLPVGRADAGDVTPTVQRFTAEPVGAVRNVRADASGEGSVLQTVVGRLAGYGPPAHEVWLPPLEGAPALDALFGDIEFAELTVPIGIVDRPFEQRRTPLIVELSGSAGNIGVVGGPQSGKTTTLRTLITALALAHDPGRVQFYCLDFGGGALASVRSLPHVGSVAGRAERELAGRTIAELEALIVSREALFRGHGIDSMTQYRRCKARRDPVCDRFGDVFLVIDGWTGLRSEFDEFEASVTALAAQGLSFGVHVVVSASRWAELRPALKDQLGTRIELRLGDPADSELDRRRAAEVPDGKPGRGLSRDGQHMAIALPRLDGAEVLRSRHPEERAPQIQVLPTHIDWYTVVDSAPDDVRNRILLGVEERRLSPVAVDFQEHSHLLVLGSSGCGKTAGLRTLCREVMRTATAAQAQLFIVDFRRTLLGVVESDHLGGYVMSPAALSALLPELVQRLHARMPPSQITQAQLRARSWWTGPDLYVVIDDYDLVTTAGGNPLSPILEYVPHAKDLGLHLVVARRSGGAARAMYDPLLAELRDLGCMGLMMSASPDEGPLIGSVRPSPLPAGRGTLVTRNGERLQVQVGWSPPP